jgi:hypothetical protein
MIRVNDRDWPLITIEVGPDSLDVAALQLPAFSRLCLPEPRVILGTIAGRGVPAVTSLDTLVAWIRQFELVLTTHARGIAWAVEDDTLRTCVAALLRLQDGFAFGCPARVFPSVQPAAAWLSSLLDVPVPATVRPASPF